MVKVQREKNRSEWNGDKRFGGEGGVGVLHKQRGPDGPDLPD